MAIFNRYTHKGMVVKNRLRQNVLKISFLISISVFSNGCVGIGTFQTFEEPKLYSAIRYDFTTCDADGFQAVACTIFNMPVDLVFDTAFLPYKTYLILDEDDNKSEVLEQNSEKLGPIAVDNL